MSEEIMSSGEPAPRTGRLARLTAWVAALTPGQAVLLIILVSAAIRVIVTSQMGIETDSTYSAVISRQWSWSYFDHPPMHYLFIRLSRMFGSDFGLAVRLPFLLLFAGSTWLLFRLTAIASGERAGLWAAIAFNLCGIFTLAYSHFLVPDGPLFFFLLLAARLLAPVLLAEGEHPSADLHWIGAGLAGGGALLSKYSAVFFFAGVFLFLLTSKPHRHWFARRGPWIAAALSALMFLPVIWWNWQHDWASFAFQGRRAVPASGGNVLLLLESIGLQMLFLLPWFYIPMAYVFLKALIQGPSRPAHWFFVCLAMPVIVFPLLSIFSRGLPHWTLPGWLFVFPLLGAEIVQLNSAWQARARQTAVRTAVFLLVVAGLLVAEARSGLYAQWASRTFPAAQLYVRDPMVAVYDWQELGPALRARGLLGDDVKFIAAFHWHSTARIGYVLGRQYPVLCVGEDMRHFRFMQDQREFAGATGLLIDYPEYVDPHRALIDAQFERREKLEPITLTRGGRPALVLSVERVSGFKPR
jgi:4-amino-4-deoxy-L-arabinose transferase-like glycosyltransferase